MSSFKIKLLKAQTTTSSLPFPPKGNLEVRLDHFCSRLDTIDHWLGKGREGAMVLSNLWDRHFVVKKMKNSSHFLSYFYDQKISLTTSCFSFTGITEKSQLNGSRTHVMSYSSQKTFYNWMQRTIMHGNIDSGSSKSLVCGRENWIMQINF